MSQLFAFLSAPAPTEMIVLLVIAVLLFGQNLPEVLRKLGKSYAEFRRGMKKIEDEIRSVTSDFTSSTTSQSTTTKLQDDPSDRDEPTAPKFEPPPG
ncbi:MAG TPA: twin-arginine translocase TatA/TatE family subunit [Thermoguttaceae bacterium]